VPTTPDTSGHTYQPELLQCDQVSVSLKTSKDISRWGCPTSSKTWQDWVTERRGAYSRRLKSAQSISASGFSFWPSVVASEVRQGFQDRSRGKKGSQESLTTAVILRGQADRANSNTNGSRQELLVDWRTPQANEAGARVETLYTKDGQPARPGERAYRKTPSGAFVLQSQTINQQVEMVSRQESWRTPTSFDWKNTDCSTQVYLSDQVEGRTKKQWATPQASDPQHSGPNQRDSSGRPALPAQAVREQSWLTPKVPSGGGQATRTTEGGGLRKLEDQTEAKATGKLNPRWVETLMGLSVGWVMPSCASPVTIEPTNSDSSATELSPPPPNELFEFCLQS
jgi:hypothetical protein